MNSRLEALLVCEDVREAHWELPISAAAVSLTLLGWVVRPDPVDAGVPAPVANLLADLLVRFATVSYFSGELDAGVLGRLLSRGAPACVCHSRDAQTIAELFRDDYFHWSQKAQAAFLSPPDSAPPHLRIQDLEDALAGRNYASFRSRDIVALIIPGVDGDVAGFYALQADLWPRIRTELQQAVTAKKVEWRLLDERAFARALAETSSTE
jgi:hypothetical protein